MGKALSSARRPGATVLRLSAGASAAILLGILGTTGASAFSEEHIQHFIECKILLLTDPEEHAAQCLPSRVELSFGTLAPGIAGGPPPVIKQDDPIVVDEGGCKDSEECCEFGDSFCERG